MGKEVRHFFCVLKELIICFVHREKPALICSFATDILRASCFVLDFFLHNKSRAVGVRDLNTHASCLYVH